MTATSHTAPIKFAGSTLGDFHHICAFFSSQDEEYRTTLPFMRDGLAAGDRLVNFVPQDRTDHEARLRAGGIDVDGSRRTRQLEDFKSEDAYIEKNGHFDGESMLRLVPQMLTNGRDQVPLAEHVRVPAPVPEHFGNGGAFERDVAVRVRETGRRLGDASHAVGGVIPARQQRRAGGRAQSRRVPVRVREPRLGELVDVRGLDQPAPGLHRRKADVVEHDVEDVGSPRRSYRLQIRLPVWNRVPIVEVDRSPERLGHLDRLLSDLREL
jgi:hypothetical protein